MLDLLGGRLRAGDARSRRDNGGVRVETFQVECECDLWAIQLRIAVAAGRPNNNICEVCRVTGRESISQAEQSSRVGHAEMVVHQGFAVAAAKIRELRGITIARL